MTEAEKQMREIAARVFDELEIDAANDRVMYESARTMARFVMEGLDEDEIIDAAEVTANQLFEAPYRRWKYFCGVCWHKIRDLKEIAHQEIIS